ncbi:MAG: alpha/beta fold hydrolase [Bacilli bacterium]|nr:alpha/beta fold hydrolase [Bacilli bacterium]
MKKAILVIHGFVGSLYDNEYLMNYLELDNRFKVFARTLPGHHTNDNYQHVGFMEWIEFADKWIQEIIGYGYKNIYVIGHSMGGILAGYLGSKYAEVKKVIFINAAFKYLNLKQNKIDIIENKDYKDYLEVLTRVIHTTIPFFLEFTKLVKEYSNCLDKISTNKEVLVLQSNEDQVVPIENGINIIDNLKCNKYLTYLDKERHGVFEGNTDNIERKKEIAEYIRLFLRGGKSWRKTWKEKI